MSRRVLVRLDADDAESVGLTLMMLARSERSPDPGVGERLSRVGDQLRRAGERARRDRAVRR